MDEREKSMTQYFTAIYADLTEQERAAICENDKCRFMSHSHVADERDAHRLDKELLAAELSEARAELAALKKQLNAAYGCEDCPGLPKLTNREVSKMAFESVYFDRPELKAQSELIGTWRTGFGLELTNPIGGITDGTKLYTAPQPNPDAQDAARYRWLAECDLDLMRAKYWPDGEVPTGEELDAAIDHAMQKGGA
jgi:hypothetical protein